MIDKKILKQKIQDYNKKLKEFKYFLKENKELLSKKFYIVRSNATKTNMPLKEFLTGDMNMVVHEGTKYINWQKQQAESLLKQYMHLEKLYGDGKKISQYYAQISKLNILEKKFNDLSYVDPMYPEIAAYTLDKKEKDVYKRYLLSQEIKEVTNNIDRNYSDYKLYFGKSNPIQQIKDVKTEYDKAMEDLNNREQTIVILRKIERDYDYLNKLHAEIQNAKSERYTPFYEELQL